MNFHWEKMKKKGGREGKREEGREKGQEGRGKDKGAREKEIGGREGKGKKPHKKLTKNSIRNALKYLRGYFKVDLFRAPKRTIILLKSKNLLCKGALHPPPPQYTSSKFARA